jgi:hypothetical protein
VDVVAVADAAAAAPHCQRKRKRKQQQQKRGTLEERAAEKAGGRMNLLKETSSR